MKRALMCSLIAFTVLTIFSAMAYSDTIKLKNGSVIKGKVTTYNDREFTVYLDLGSSTKRSSSRMVISIDDVESIQFDTNESNTVASPGNQTYTPPPQNSSSISNQSSSQAAKPVNQPASTPSLTTPRSIEPGTVPLLEKTVGVIAAADWTSTEIQITKGQRIVISASGQVGLGGNRKSGPEGNASLVDNDKLLASSPTGALIAVIGDDNNDFIQIGATGEFVAQRDGVLFLSVNEGNLKDNTGSFSAKIKIFNR